MASYMLYAMHMESNRIESPSPVYDEHFVLWIRDSGTQQHTRYDQHL